MSNHYKCYLYTADDLRARRCFLKQIPNPLHKRASKLLPWVSKTLGRQTAYNGILLCNDARKLYHPSILIHQCQPIMHHYIPRPNHQAHLTQSPHHPSTPPLHSTSMVLKLVPDLLHRRVSYYPGYQRLSKDN